MPDERDPPASPVADVLVLQHAAPETPGLVGEALARAGHRLRVVRSWEGEPVPTQLGDAAGLVVMGGPMSVYERAQHPFLGAELRLLESALRDARPVLGVCLGSQLLAHTLGAAVRPGPAKEIGWHEVTLFPDAARDPLFGAAPRHFIGFHWHGDVFELPGGAVSLARSERTECQAFRFGARAWGLLFHLEVTAPIVAGMVRAFPDELAAAGVDGDAVLAAAPDRLPALHAVADPAFAAFAACVTEAAGTRPSAPGRGG